VNFDSKFYLNNGDADLTATRVRRALQDLKDGMARDIAALANKRARIVDLEREAYNLRNAPVTTSIAQQAEILLRDQRLKEIDSEYLKATLLIKNLSKSIPKAEADITQVDALLVSMNDWAQRGRIHYRIGATTRTGDITLITTRGAAKDAPKPEVKPNSPFRTLGQ
jgi:hypothetical protein